jgi:hypothetical protein
MKDGFNQKLEIFLRKSENNNFFTTLFMLNVKDSNDYASTISEKQLSDYSFNKSDEKLLKNTLFENIIKEFWKNSRENLK